MKTLKDVMPKEFMGVEYRDIPARKYKDINVLSIHNEKWPGPHRNVYLWCILDNGKAVGWNENPSRGWSFPVMKMF